MAVVRKTITLTEQQDVWIAAQIEAGRYTNDSEAISDLIRREQARSFETETIRRALIEVAYAKLVEASLLAQDCSHIRPGYRRQGVERHVIYSRVTPYGISVVRLLHARMDAMQRLMQRETGN